MKDHIFYSALCFILCPLIIFASKEPGKKVVALKSNTPIKIDGVLNEQIWKSEPITDFTQRDPVQGQPATEVTHTWVVYDESYLYIGAQLFDSNIDSIDRSLYRRDNMVESDWFFLFIDPYYDRRTGYYFAINPGGSILDGTLFNDSWDDNSWDGIWFAHTAINSSGWSLEMKIPFSQIRFNESEKMVWGINFNRDIKRKNENDYFIMVPKNESGFVSHFADLIGLDGITPKQRVELLPYLVQKAQYLVHDSNDPFYRSNQYSTSLGGDLKLGIGSNLNIDATFNPDFGQVEVDPAVVNLSAFETFYKVIQFFGLVTEDPTIIGVSISAYLSYFTPGELADPRRAEFQTEPL